MEDLKAKVKDALELIDALTHSLNDIFVTDDAAEVMGEMRAKEVRAALRVKAVATMDKFGLLTDTPAVNPVVGDLRRWLATSN